MKHVYGHPVRIGQKRLKDSTRLYKKLTSMFKKNRKSCHGAVGLAQTAFSSCPFLIHRQTKTVCNLQHTPHSSPHPHPPPPKHSLFTIKLGQNKRFSHTQFLVLLTTVPLVFCWENLSFEWL